MVKVEVDQDTCIACGQCYATCPEVYQDDGTGTAEIVDEYQENEVYVGRVPDDIECTQEGADVCPVDAIKVS
ncbi:MAG: ferredoxin [Candidatus Natronoplasma sp.]